jgi:hypothetical protein
MASDGTGFTSAFVLHIFLKVISNKFASIWRLNHLSFDVLIRKYLLEFQRNLLLCLEVTYSRRGIKILRWSLFTNRKVLIFQWTWMLIKMSTRITNFPCRAAADLSSSFKGRRVLVLLVVSWCAA